MSYWDWQESFAGEFTPVNSPKLVREIEGAGEQPTHPASQALPGFGLAGMGLVRRSRKTAYPPQ